MGRCAAPSQGDVFGGEGRARYYGGPVYPAGYARAPGTGPKGQTCSGCDHCRLRVLYAGTPKQKRVRKCWLTLPTWTKSRETDINARSPACSEFLPAKPHKTEHAR